jgi:ribonuclease J
MGVSADNILILENGDVVQLTPDSISKGESVTAGIELLDASREGIVDNRVLKERQQLAEDGVITVLAAVSTDGVMVAPPRVNLRGVVTSVDAKKMSLWTEREISWVLENRWKQLARQTAGTAIEVDWMGLQREVEVGLARRMRRELQVEPLILCLVQPAPGGTPAYKGRTDVEPEPRTITKRTDASVHRDVSASSSSAASASNASKAEVTTKSKVTAEKKVESQTELPAGRTRRRRSAVA